MKELGLSLMVFFPFLGAMGFGFSKGSAKPKHSDSALYVFGLASSLLAAFFGIAFCFGLSIESSASGIQQNLNWVGSFLIQYSLGMDGALVPALILMSVVFPVLILFERTRPGFSFGRIAVLLLCQGSLLGLVLSRDLFMTVFFGMLSAVPFYFMTAIWGEKESESAAFRFLFVSSLSGILFFLSMIFVFYASKGETFAIRELVGLARSSVNGDFFGHEFSLRTLAFWLFLASFLLRFPCWPVQGWFGFTSQCAHESTLVGLSSAYFPVWLMIFFKLGYGLFPLEFAQAAPVLMAIGALNLVMGAVLLVGSEDLRSFYADSTMALLGAAFVGVGSMDGAGLVGLSFHTLSMGLALACFGIFIGIWRDRTGSTLIQSGGPIGEIPALALFAALTLGAMMGIPGSAGFVSMFLIVMGSVFEHPLAVGFFAFGLLFLAIASFALFRTMFLGKAKGDVEGKFELVWKERVFLYPVLLFIIFLGVYPKPLLDLIKPATALVLSSIK